MWCCGSTQVLSVMYTIGSTNGCCRQGSSGLRTGKSPQSEQRGLNRAFSPLRSCSLLLFTASLHSMRCKWMLAQLRKTPPPTRPPVTGCARGRVATPTATPSPHSSATSTGATCWMTGAQPRPRSRYRLWSSWRPRWPNFQYR